MNTNKNYDKQMMRLIDTKQAILVTVPPTASNFWELPAISPQDSSLIHYILDEEHLTFEITKGDYTVLTIACFLPDEVFAHLVAQFDFESSSVPLYQNYMYLQDSKDINKCVGFANPKSSFESLLTLHELSMYSTLVIFKR